MILFIRSLRIHQWLKNFFIFAPVIFSLNFFHWPYLKNSLIAFGLFSLVTGSIYIFNDCFDRKYDKLHPEKSKRPIASGALSLPVALAGASILLLVALAAISYFHRGFFVAALFYVGLNLAYSSYFKKIVIFDVMIIGVGFVLRVQIGGVINKIVLSPWILIITFLIAMLLGLIKRRQELIKVTENSNGPETRQNLRKYNLALLDQLISISTSTTLISYIIYVLNPGIQEKFHTNYLYLTIPFVAFGIFRYLYLTYSRGMGENPAEIIFSDIPFTVNILLWVMVFVLLIQ